MATHELKTWPTFFEAMARGDKTFEVRRNDRDFQVGDMLMLREFDPQSHTYSGRSAQREIGYIMRATEGEQFGLRVGHVVMALRSTSSRDQ